MARIAIVCFDSVTDIDVFLHWDILNRPKTMFPVPDEEWQVHFLGTESKHTTQAGLELPMDGMIDDAKGYDVVLHASGPATRDLMHDVTYLHRLSLSPIDQYVCSQCSGSLILAAAGCFEGLTATTYPSASRELESFGVSFCPEPFIGHERVASAAGCLAGVELDHWILSRFVDPGRSISCVNSAKPWGNGLEAVVPDGSK